MADWIGLRDVKLTRAQFLRLAACTGGALVTGGIGAEAAAPLILRSIPKSGEKLPVIGLGTAHTFNVGAEAAERAPIREVIRLFLEQGGKLIDSSASYGESERVTGDILAELGGRSRSFIATKVSTRGREEGIAQMEESMRLFRTKVIDLMQVHNLKDTKTHLRTIRAWRDAGKIRYVGVTHFRPSAIDELVRLIRTEPLDFVQFSYSMVSREAEERLLPACADKGVAFIVNLPYGRGKVFRSVRGKGTPSWLKDFGAESWGQFFLKYLISLPAVTAVLPATTKARHLLDNMAAGRGHLPGAAERKKMVQMWKKLAG